MRLLLMNRQFFTYRFQRFIRAGLTGQNLQRSPLFPDAQLLAYVHLHDVSNRHTWDRGVCTPGTHPSRKMRKVRRRRREQFQIAAGVHTYTHRVPGDWWADNTQIPGTVDIRDSVRAEPSTVRRRRRRVFNDFKPRAEPELFFKV